MIEYFINVYFKKRTIETNLIQLVKNDYNSTRIKFNFDEQGKVLIKMLYPNKKTFYIDELKNNELILGKGILQEEGTYTIEICLYKEDSRLTNATTVDFYVRNEIVTSDEIIIPESKIQIIDTLINDVRELEEEIEEKVEKGDFDGATFTPIVSEEGIISWRNDKNKENPAPVNIRGPQGKPGKNGTAYDDAEIRRELNNLDIEVGKLSENINEIVSDVDSLERDKANRTELPDVSDYAKKTDIPDVSNLVEKEKFDAGLATRLTTDLSNIDNAGIEKIKEISGGFETDVIERLRQLTSLEIDNVAIVSSLPSTEQQGTLYLVGEEQ